MPPADPVTPSCAPARCRVGAGPAGRLGSAPGAASPRACAWLCRPARPRLAQTDTCTSLRLPYGPRTVWGRATVRGVGSGARERGGPPLPRTRPGCRCRCRAAAWGMVPLAGGMVGVSRLVHVQDAHAHTRTAGPLWTGAEACRDARCGRRRSHGRALAWRGSRGVLGWVRAAAEHQATPAQAVSPRLRPVRRRHPCSASDQMSERLVQLGAGVGPGTRLGARGREERPSCSRPEALGAQLGPAGQLGGDRASHTPHSRIRVHRASHRCQCACVCLCVFVCVHGCGCGQGREGGVLRRAVWPRQARQPTGAGLHPHVWWLPQLDGLPPHPAEPRPAKPPEQAGTRSRQCRSHPHDPTPYIPGSCEQGRRQDSAVEGTAPLYTRGGGGEGALSRVGAPAAPGPDGREALRPCFPPGTHGAWATVPHALDMSTRCGAWRWAGRARTTRPSLDTPAGGFPTRRARVLPAVHPRPGP